MCVCLSLLYAYVCAFVCTCEVVLVELQVSGSSRFRLGEEMKSFPEALNFSVDQY